jgi:hypothetical protein
MKNIARLICLLGALSLTGCGGEPSHSHGEGTAAHSHDGVDHEHGDDHPAHGAPETEAFYGEEADAAIAAPPSRAAAEDEAAGEAEPEGMHTHGDGAPHTHDH